MTPMKRLLQSLAVALATGAAMTMPATKPTVAHEVKVEGDQVFVRLHHDA